MHIISTPRGGGMLDLKRGSKEVLERIFGEKKLLKPLAELLRKSQEIQVGVFQRFFEKKCNRKMSFGRLPTIFLHDLLSF